MKKIIAKIDFALNGEDYIAGDEIKTDNINIIRKLNEKGFIDPLEHRDLILIQRELEKKKNEL